MQLAYKNKKRFTKRIDNLYLKLDSSDSNSISLNEFFELIDYIILWQHILKQHLEHITKL